MDTELICKNLQSLERSDRQKSLNDLLKYCNDANTNSEEELKDLISIYDKCYLHILKCYSDRFESCRELACQVVTAFILKLPKNDFYLQYIVSTFASRIGQKELQEHSEEIRLIFLKQLHFLIDRFRYEKATNSDPLLKSYNEIIDIFLKTLNDSYPLIQRETCNCIKLLSEATPSFHYRAEILTKSLYPILYHKHSANRIAAIEALGIVCLHIFTNSDCIIKIISEISPLVMDTQPLVRKECGKVGCMWLLKLKDRYSLFDRILPIVLCCLKDDSPDVRDHIEKLWIKCGDLYFEENQTELDRIAIIDHTPENYTKDIKRPTLGCRALVQRNLKIIKSIMWETSDWKEDVRLHSLKLMWQIVLHAEKTISTKFTEIFPDLGRSCEDSDANVAKMATKVAELMGRFMYNEDWFELGLDYLKERPKLGYLKCFYFMYSSSKIDGKNEILAIAKVLTRSEFSNSLRSEVQYYVLKLLDILWERYQKQESIIKSEEETIEKAMEKMKLENDEIEEKIYHSLIKVIALSFDETNPDGNSIHQQGKIILKKLSRDNDRMILELHKSYLNSVIKIINDSLDFELTEFAEPILLFYGLIRICGFQKSYLNSLKESIKMIWENSSSDGKIKIFTAISIAMLTWNATMLFDVVHKENEKNNDEIHERNFQLLKEFIEDIIAPHLIWKPGATAESMRTLATATLHSMAQSGAKNESLKILPEYASIFQNLIEDNCVMTRIYALKCLKNFGAIKYEQLKPIAYAVLQRLDDPSAEVRIWAAQVLSKFDTSQINNDEMKGWYIFIKQALKMLFLHFDGPEIKLRNTITDTVIEIGKQYPEIFDESYSKAYEICANKDKLNGIQKTVKMI